MARGTVMSEADWLNRADLYFALNVVGAGMSPRKLRLLACGCCRLVWPLVRDPRARAALEVAERYADGARGSAVMEAVRRFPRPGAPGVAAAWAAEAVTCLLSQVFVDPVPNLHEIAEHAARADRDAAGAADWSAARRRQVACLCDLQGRRFHAAPIDEAWRLWRGGLVPAMAKAIYDDYRFGDLPILADALEEAGCADAAILDHCRSGREHVRGCWVIDLLLDKE
jgi:hypothetical protein